MKTLLGKISIITFLATAPAFAAEKEGMVILKETEARNLRIETVVAEEADFEESVFALGRIAAKPGMSSSVASRVSGRLTELAVLPGDQVRNGQEVAKVETRQPGNPPPTVALTALGNGLVTALDVRLGDPVEPDRALIEITDLSEVHAVAQVPEHLAGQMKPGAQAHIKISALPGEDFEGTLLRFGTAANTESGTLDAIFVLPNASGHLRPGMRAEFSIVLKKRPGVLSIPRAALQGDAANRFVYVKDFDLANAFHKAPVVVGESNDRSVEIVSGLFPADEVVTRGAYSLAFAGGGSVSLKEALDAAHGHEHNADGSEITGDEEKEGTGAHTAHAEAASGPFWKIVSGVLFVLLVITLARGKGAATRA